MMLGMKVRLACATALVVAFAMVVPGAATALTIRQGDVVAVARGETISDDLYAFGNTVTIDGTVDGDVFAFGQTVIVRGQVGRSLTTAAQNVRVDGSVDGSVRAAGQMVDISGQVDGDTVAAANRVAVQGTVNRDLAAGAQTVAITGVVGRNVMVGAETLAIDGDVGGNVKADSTNVVVGADGSVAGTLDYTSDTPAVVNGDVGGATTRHEPPPKRRGGTGGASGIAGAILAAAIAWVQSFIGVLILGLLLVLIPRGPMRVGSQAALNRPWLSLGVGALVFFVTPMVALFVFVLGLFVGAWWLAFVLLAAFSLLLLLGVIAGGLAVGRFLLRHADKGGEPALVWSLLLGLVLVWIVGAVPLVGPLAGWAVTMVGAGALLLAWMGKGGRPPTPVFAAGLPPGQSAAQPQPPYAPPTQSPPPPGEQPAPTSYYPPYQPPAN